MAATKVRMSTGLRGTTHAMTWLGTQAGVFARHGLDVEFPAFEVGGPESAAGLVRGEWDFVQTGTIPMAEEVLRGGDAVILLRNCVEHVSTFLMAPREITALEQLDGRTVGVLTDVTSGQTGVVTRRMFEARGVTPRYVGLGTYPNIFKALAAGDIDAGAMQIDLRFAGERRYGWNAFELTQTGLPSIFGTTRRVIAADRDVVLRAVAAVVETIHVFKTQPDVMVPLLQRLLAIEERAVAEDVHRYYAPLFPPAPRPELAGAMPWLHDLFAGRYPGAAALRESDIADSSFIDELERNGFVQRLYADPPRRAPSPAAP